MKKVGIMSMQRVENYGSFLQAYGLKKLVEEIGADVEFIDYRQGPSLIKKKKQALAKIKKGLHFFDYIEHAKFKKRMVEKYENSFLPILGISKEKKNYSRHIDLLIIGSDEVFNPIQPEPRGFSEELFGANHENIPIISYAACFGYCNLEDLYRYNIADRLGGMLDKFEAVSVRDQNSYEIVEKISHKKPVINLDPVLMYDFEKELVKSTYDFSNYIILYAYPGRFSKKESEEIKKLAKKYNKMIVSVGFYHRIADACIIPDVFEIFDLFRKADFVITDTFHGTIFSIKTGTNFCSIVRDTHSNKLADLLNRLKLNERIIINSNAIEKKFLNRPDFDKANEVIKNEKKRARNYLEKYL